MQGVISVTGNCGQIVLPQLTNPAAVRFTGGRGHVITDEWPLTADLYVPTRKTWVVTFSLSSRDL